MQQDSVVRVKIRKAMTNTDQIDWSACSVVQRNPRLLHGDFNINGKRITPDTIVGNFESGLSISEIREQFPSVDEQEIRTILDYAAKHGLLTRPAA